eukprot:IDg19233t1
MLIIWACYSGLTCCKYRRIACRCVGLMSRNKSRADPFMVCHRGLAYVRHGRQRHYASGGKRLRLWRCSLILTSLAQCVGHLKRIKFMPALSKGYLCSNGRLYKHCAHELMCNRYGRNASRCYSMMLPNKTAQDDSWRF